ncbi:fibrillin-2-like [Pecten maximus]|uniref:fibrillin-2-like n=1 Tax=Pecten maximus TaxID=6579 RepID=UPI0014585E3E|nr:fibrillin-2-like [Pecten maximus]
MAISMLDMILSHLLATVYYVFSTSPEMQAAEMAVCTPPSDLQYGQVVVWGPNLLIEYICEEGFFANGETFGACITEEGRWTIEKPKCVATGCDPPRVPHNMHVRLEMEGAVAHFSCGRGHYLIGQSQAYCNGQNWTKPFPSCVGSSVRTRADPQNRNLPGRHVRDPLAFNVSAIDFAANLRVSDNTCFRYRYKAPPEIEHGTASPRYLYNQQRRSYVLVTNYTCDPGYVIENNLTRYYFCKNYQWVAPVAPKCIKPLESTACQGNRRLCHQICVPGIRNRFACDCFRGFLLHSNGRDCFDHNECLFDNGGCEQECHNTYGSRICSCRDGYRRAGTRCIDVNECDDDSVNECPGECDNTEGSYRCNCTIPGYMDSWDGRSCYDDNECTLDYGGCEDICINVIGSYYCKCTTKEGYQLSSDMHNCTDLDECEVYGKKICDNGRCVNTVGSYVCECDDGFLPVKDRTKCEDIDECKTQNGECEDLCVNSIGSFNCDCQETGFQIDSGGKNCTDIDECIDNAPKCENDCVNTVGSFYCWCHWHGYVVHENQRNCTHCRDDQYIIEHDKLCVDCPNNSYIVRTLPGAANSLEDCQCLPGYVGSPAEKIPCQDVDECLVADCEYECQNDEGSFSCQCPEGFVLMEDGRTCTDIDECETDDGGCNVTCVNTLGSFHCACPYPGFLLSNDSISCDDVNECLMDDNYNCSQLCYNTEGGAECSCHPGYVLSTDNHTCEDIDECANSSLSMCEDICINTNGSFYCDCEGTALKLSWDRRSCSDINECMEGVNHCEDLCVNTYGSYYCDCNTTGFVLATDQRTCEDLDECLSNTTNQCDQVCVNRLQGYDCSCYQGYVKEDLYGCRGCDIGQYHDNDTDSCVECPPMSTTNGTGKVNRTDCICIPGYTEDTTGRSYCRDIDECDEGEDENFGCGQICVNTKGSAYCACQKGFNLHKNRKNCTDIDECLYSNHYCAEICINLEGSYKCACREGFKLHWDNKYCTDINECYTGAHECEDQCENTWGSYICGCTKPGTRLTADRHTCIALVPTCPDEIHVEVPDGVPLVQVVLPSIVYNGQWRIEPDWVAETQGVLFPVGNSSIQVISYNTEAGQVSCTFHVVVTVSCARGTFRSSDDVYAGCTQCPPGTYQDDQNKRSCKPCIPGTYQDEYGQLQCKYCKIGMYQDRLNQSECIPCPPGTYLDESGSAGCKPCRVGQYNSLGSQSSCNYCTAGTYQDQAGQTECQECETGHYQLQMGQPTCKLCPEDLTPYMADVAMVQQCQRSTDTLVTDLEPRR